MVDFYKGRLVGQFGLSVLTPNEKDREIIHNVIYEELCLGRQLPSSKSEYWFDVIAIKKVLFVHIMD
jgi:aspartate racemase